jgi:hypothetical protein
MDFKYNLAKQLLSILRIHNEGLFKPMQQTGDVRGVKKNKK